MGKIKSCLSQQMILRFQICIHYPASPPSFFSQLADVQSRRRRGVATDMSDVMQGVKSAVARRHVGGGWRVTSSINHLQHRLPRLHVGEDFHTVRHLAKGGRVVVGVHNQDVDGDRAALLDAIRRRHLWTGGKFFAIKLYTKKTSANLFTTQTWNVYRQQSLTLLVVDVNASIYTITISHVLILWIDFDLEVKEKNVAGRSQLL